MMIYHGIHGEDMAPAAFLYLPPSMSPPLHNHKTQLFVSLSQRAPVIFHWRRKFRFSSMLLGDL